MDGNMREQSLVMTTSYVVFSSSNILSFRSAIGTAAKVKKLTVHFEKRRLLKEREYTLDRAAAKKNYERLYTTSTSWDWFNKSKRNAHACRHCMKRKYTERKNRNKGFSGLEKSENVYSFTYRLLNVRAIFKWWQSRMTCSSLPRHKTEVFKLSQNRKWEGFGTELEMFLCDRKNKFRKFTPVIYSTGDCQNSVDLWPVIASELNEQQ